MEPEEAGLHGGLSTQERKDLEDHRKDMDKIVNPPTAGGDDEGKDLSEKLSEMSTDALDSLEKELKLGYGSQVDDICFPLDLRDETMPNGVASQRELMRISIVSRDHEQKKNIWLKCPPGIAIPDGVEYNQVSLGTLGGRALQAAGDIYDASKGKKSWGEVGSIADLVAASTVTAIQKSGSALGEKGMMTAGLTANPYTSNAFTGTTIRTFEFAFKMVAESQDESDVIRNIENTFRKFLYPRKHPKSDMVLVYPPYWEITFWRGCNEDGEPSLEKNPYMPMIKLCNLAGMNTTFNSSGNYFHRKGAPIEVDLSLSFTESMALTREDLYQTDSGPDSVPNYGDPEYLKDGEKTNVMKALSLSSEG